jgi:RNA polymerase sigma-70 factor (ECF subfamily)
MCSFENMSDEQLMSDFAAGNQEAFNELHRRYRDDLVKYAMRVNPLGGHATAEDVVQQTFIKVHQSHDAFDPEMKFRPWLFSIAANYTVNQKIADKRRRSVSMNTRIAAAEEIQYDPPDYREDEPESGLLNAEMATVIREKISALRGPQREVLERLYFQGMTHYEAAADLGVPVGTIKSQLNRALESLRQELIPAASEAA